MRYHSALAAERLTNELALAGVSAPSYSTVALHKSVSAGQLELGSQSTVIHDEAVLASTREQHDLFSAIEASRARLIEVAILANLRRWAPAGCGRTSKRQPAHRWRTLSSAATFAPEIPPTVATRNRSETASANGRAAYAGSHFEPGAPFHSEAHVTPRALSLGEHA